MAVSNISVEITVPRWTASQFTNEIAYLRTYSQGFRALLNDVPSTIQGVQVNGVVVTDNAARFPSGTWSSSEQVWFNPNEGIIYVGVNPITVRMITLPVECSPLVN